MKTATKPGKPKPTGSFEEEYGAGLRSYIKCRTEEQLGRAYELGRRAIAEGKSLVEIAAIHHEALCKAIPGAGEGKQNEEFFQSGCDFLAEVLSPYEMTHRGFQDAVKALRQMNETLEEKIKRIACAVHDEAGQLLVAVHLALAEIERDLPKQQRARFAEIGGLLSEVESQLRRYSHELRPTILDDLGWIPAIRFLAEGVSKRYRLPIEVTATFRGRLPRTIETALYRTVQEALTNVSKHAKASRVSIEVCVDHGVLRCAIRDDGVGFDVQAPRPSGGEQGLGLIGMRERLNAIGGTVSIDSGRGRGTTLLIQLPMEDSNDDSRRSRG
jgi:signal transduction histidine kinase